MDNMYIWIICIYVCIYIYICMYVCLRKTDLLSIVKRSLLVGDSFGLYCPIYLYIYIHTYVYC